MLWAFSPLGGQASLRLLHTGVEYSTVSGSIRFLNSDSESFLNAGGDTFGQYQAIISALYLSALFSPPSSQASNMDTWGNTKIPLIEAFEQTDRSDADGWFTVDAKNKSYSSLVGVPIVGIPAEGNSNFSLETNYMILDCEVLAITNDDLIIEGNFGFDINGGKSTTNSSLSPGQGSYPQIETSIVKFNTSAGSDESKFAAKCTLTRSSVESDVQCGRSNCRVSRFRRSKFDQRPPGYPPFSSDAFIAIDTLSKRWTTVGFGHPGLPTPTIMFLSDPAMKDFAFESLSGTTSLVGLPADVFSQRLSLLLNTYYQCSLSPGYQTGNFPASGILDVDTTGNLSYGSLGITGGFYNTTRITITNNTDVYLCNRGWATILFVASSLLLGLGMFSAIVKYKLRGPQILGYVSTMTRDNPYMELPPGGCHLNGLERTRLLKDLKVQLRDVTPSHEFGHIALSNVGSSRKRRLDLNRLYAGPQLNATTVDD